MERPTFLTVSRVSILASALISSVACSGSVACTSSVDCSGFNGRCQPDGTCVCNVGWEGPACQEVRWRNRSATRAFESRLWTWGGSVIHDETTGMVHMFASELTNDCGILHYCSNSRVIHLTSQSPLGPFVFQDVALNPSELPMWDSGAVHGPTIHRLPTGDYALFYMGTNHSWEGDAQPNCTARYDPQSGDRSTRRIGVATSNSLDGPWLRRTAPIFGPGNRSAGHWDWEDVSNPTPIIFANGSTVLLYKGRGNVQAMGVAFAPRFDGPFERSSVVEVVPGEDTWGWIATDGESHAEVLHVLSHVGNGAKSAGGHAYSLDGGRSWTATEPAAFTGSVRWADGTSAVLARRERPQVLLRDDGSGRGGSYGVPEVICTSAQSKVCDQDGGPPGTYDEACRSFTMCEAVELESYSR